jgi:CAAX prenyl protease-like protein
VNATIETAVQSGRSPGRERAPFVAKYWAPIIVFGIFTAFEPYASAALYPVVYSAKLAAVIGALVWARETLTPIRPTRVILAPAILVGLAVFGQWILLDKFVAYPHFGTRASFNPFNELHSHLGISTFVAVRLVGLICVVPVMEEVFWRGFLLRAFTRYDIEQTPVEKFSLRAFCLVTLAFGFVHPEWLVALIAGAAYAWLLRSSRSLFAVILAHSVTNAALGAYILMTGDWHYW